MYVFHFFSINDDRGELRTEISEIKERWKEYMEELYSKSSNPRMEDFNLEEEMQVESDRKGPRY